MKWITRERPKIDRLACPWLIKKFIDKDAEFEYVPFDEVISRAEEQGAIPYDIPGVEFTHYGQECTFDYFIKKYDIEDSGVKIMASVIRGADTDRPELSRESSGLWAISAGLSYNITDDRQLLETGMVIYEALYSWATHLYKQKHLQSSPFENLLREVYHKIRQTEKSGKKTPLWAIELKEMIQDQVDDSFVFDLKEISGELQINPSYLSREFSKHFDNMNFGA